MNPVSNSSSVSNSRTPDFTAVRYTPPGERGRYRKNAIGLLGEALSWPIEKVAMSVLRDIIYPASSASFKSRMDESRLQESRVVLSKFGGERVLLQTPDESLIDGMFFEVSRFKESVEKLQGVFINNDKENCIEIRSMELFELVQKMRAPNLRENKIILPHSKEHSEISSKAHVMIVSQGNAGIYEMNRKAILRFLLKGKSVMVFNIRGTGTSTGVPSEKGTYNDYETAYQFLVNKGFKRDQIEVFGYCLGAGPATELAARHDLRLFLDRTFARLPDVMGRIAERATSGAQKQNETAAKGFLRTLCENVLPPIIERTVISYNNASKLHRVRQVFIHLGEEDQVIPPWSAAALLRAVNESNSSNAKRTIVKANIGHNDDWLKKSEEELEEHMGTSIRSFPATQISTAPKIANLKVKIAAKSNLLRQSLP